MRRLKKLCDCKRIHRVGKLPTAGRPMDVFADRKWKSDNMEHEIAVTKVLKQLGIEGFLRGRDVDLEILPDAQLGRFCLEMDMGTKNLTQERAKLMKYNDSEFFPVYVCKSEQRMNNILGLEFDFVLATTMLEVFKPDPRCWDCEGENYSLIKVLNKARDNLKTNQRKPLANGGLHQL